VSKPCIIADEKPLESFGNNTIDISDRSIDESLSQTKDFRQSVDSSYSSTACNYQQKPDLIPVPLSSSVSDTVEYLDNVAGNISVMHNIEILPGPDSTALNNSQPDDSIPGVSQRRDCEEEHSGGRGMVLCMQLLYLSGSFISLKCQILKVPSSSKINICKTSLVPGISTNR